MGIMVIDMLQVDADVSVSERLMLAMLGCWANSYGYCWPSLKKIADTSHTWSVRQVKRLIKQLEDRGLLYVLRGSGRGRRSEYALVAGMDEEAIRRVLMDEEAGMGLAEEQAAPIVAEILAKRPPAPEKARRAHTVKATAESPERVTPVSQRVTPPLQKVTPVSVKGDTCVTPEPRLSTPAQGAPAPNSQRTINELSGEDSAHSRGVSSRKRKAPDSSAETSPAKTRARDPLMDALCEICFGTLDAFKWKTTGGRLGKTLARIREIDPGVTAERLNAAHQRYLAQDYRRKTQPNPVWSWFADIYLAWMVDQKKRGIVPGYAPTYDVPEMTPEEEAEDEAAGRRFSALVAKMKHERGGGTV